MACAQTSVPMSCLQKVVYTSTSLSLPALYRLLRSHCQNSRILWLRASKSCENGSEDKEPNAANTLWSTARSIWVCIRKEQRLVKWRNAWPSWEMTISSPSRSLSRTPSMYVLPSSHCSHFVAHGRPSQKHMPRLLTVMCMCQFNSYLDAGARHTLQICTPSTYVRYLFLR